MGIAEGMKNIVENIVDSHDIRGKELNRLSMDTKRVLKDARATVQDFSKERKVNAAEQAKKLAGFADDLKKDVGGMLKGFSKNHKEMSEKQAKDLSVFIGKLEDDVEKLKDGVSLMRNDFRKNHQQMAEELRGQLAKEVKDIKTHVKGILDDADELVSGYRSDMKGARAAWQGISSPKIAAKEKATKAEEIVTKKPFENKTEKKAAKKKKK